ncbi:MAG TPA: hypothetical protein VM847_21445, partial [Tahibacter sp.]|nr:hypothetical protein [Tahibacter sp.]
LDAARDVAGELGGGAVAAVVDDQDFAHRRSCNGLGQGGIGVGAGRPPSWGVSQAVPLPGAPLRGANRAQVIIAAPGPAPTGTAQA